VLSAPTLDKTKRKTQRAGVRANIGKGSPKEIFDEVEIQEIARKKIRPENVDERIVEKSSCVTTTSVLTVQAWPITFLARRK